MVVVLGGFAALNAGVVMKDSGIRLSPRLERTLPAPYCVLLYVGQSLPTNCLTLLLETTKLQH